MAPYGALWSLMEPHGGPWGHMGPYGALWSPMEPYGALCSPMQPYVDKYTKNWRKITIRIQINATKYNDYVDKYANDYQINLDQYTGKCR